jgi:hypothetical protein
MGSLGAKLVFVTTLAPPSHRTKPRRFLGFWAVRVAADIAVATEMGEHLLGASVRSLDVNHPLGAAQVVEAFGEGLALTGP